MADNNTKSIIFLGFVILIVVFVFLLLQNAEFITENALLVGLILVFLYLIAKYDYILQLRDFERAVIFRFGKVNRVKGPGWTMVFPPAENYTTVDLRTKTIDIPRQQVITKDNVEVTIDAVIFLKVSKETSAIINSVIEVDDYTKASKLYVIGLIRDKAGSLELTELISQVEELNTSLKEDLEKIAKKWGVIVEEASIKDINIPREVMQAMHHQKAAVQKKLARMEDAKGHQAEIEAIRAAAENLGDKAIAYYYIRALEKIGEGKSTKFILPMELTNLAKSLSGKSGEENVEQLLKDYAPVVKNLLGKNSEPTKKKKSDK